MSFAAKCMPTVLEFLQTVVVVDDNAKFFAPSSIGDVPVDIPDHLDPDAIYGAPVLSRPAEEGEGRSTDSTLKAAERQGQPEEEAKPKTTDNGDALERSHDLDARALTEAFAARELVCAVLQPIEGAEDISVALLLASKRADVLVLDWILQRQEGGYRTAQELILKIVEQDQVDGRQRLILIYTGEPKIRTILAGVKTAIEEKVGETVRMEQDNLALSHGGLRIAIYSKAKGLDTDRKVAEQDLPEAVVAEYAVLTGGLVRNVAMHALAAVRRRTHDILSRLDSDLDAPYIVHRCHQKTPEEAEGFLVSMVASEIADVIHDRAAPSPANLTMIGHWLDELLSKAGVAAALKASLNVGDVDQVGPRIMVNAEKGQDEANNFKFAGIWRTLAGELLSDAERGETAERQFAYIASVKSRREAPTPQLRLGQVLIDLNGKFYLCIQPVCDSVRITSERSFLMLKLNESANNSFDLIVKHAGALKKLLLPTKAYELETMRFSPNDAKAICAVKQGEKWVFTSNEDNREFEWVAELKPDFAQRIAESRSNLMSRIGLSEPFFMQKSKPADKG